MRKVCGIVLASILLFLLASCNNTNESESSVGSETAGEVKTNVESSQEQENENITKIIRFIQEEQFGTETWYSLAYCQGDDTEEKYGYMNIQGEIIQESPNVPYTNDSGVYTIYNEVGDEVYTSPSSENWQILCGTEDGVYLAEEITSGLESNAIYVGLIDRTGNWMYDGPVNFDEVTDLMPFLNVNLSADLGDNMLGTYCVDNNGNCLLLFNGETGKCFPIDNVRNRNLEFYNGTMIVQYWDGGNFGSGDLGSIYSINKEGIETKLSAEGELLCSDEKGFITDANGITLYNRTGEELWTFDRYEFTDEFDPILFDDVVIIYVKGADLLNYVCCINRNTGEVVYEPFQDFYGYIYDHYILTMASGNMCFIDLKTGETVAVLDKNFELNDVKFYKQGLYIIPVSGANEYDCLFYNCKGETIVPVLKRI